MIPENVKAMYDEQGMEYLLSYQDLYTTSPDYDRNGETATTYIFADFAEQSLWACQCVDGEPKLHFCIDSTWINEALDMYKRMGGE